MIHEYIAQVSEVIEAPADKVWEALVTPEIIQKYFFDTHAESEWKVGSPITFSGEWEGNTYKDKGTILNLEPGALLKYNYWSSMSGMSDTPDNYVDITNEIREHDGKTMITVSQDNIPTEKLKRHAIENWTKVLKNLKDLLEHEN